MKKLKLIIIFTVPLLIIFIFLLLSIFTNQNTTPQPSQTTTPTPVIINTSDLFITSITPQDTNRTYLPGQPIEVTFTQVVDRKSLKLTITPETEVLINLGNSQNTLIISPLTIWQNGVTTISILSQTQSISGKTLKNPQVYQLKTAIPTLPQNAGDAY